MYSQSTTASLADLALPMKEGWGRIARDAALVLGFALFIALFARLSLHLPFTPVPVTGQTFAVLLTGAAVGSWRGAGAAGIYLLGGMFLPFYAGSSDSYLWDASVSEYVFGFTSGSSGFFWGMASGGYIIGFIAAAYVVGFLCERGVGSRVWLLPTLLVGNILVYVPGLIQLSLFAPAGKTLEWGLYPFIAGDLLKLVVAGLLVPAAWGIANRWLGGDDEGHRRPDS